MKKSTNHIPVPEGYALAWSDEFDTDGPPNPRNWKLERGYVRNNEHQWYQKDNAWCENGMLIIEGRKERKPNPSYDPFSDDWKKNREFIEYTSASLNTYGLHSWQYGRIEMRAKIEASDGLWPTFWSMGIEGEWPSNGEVDIMEYYQGHIMANFAWGTSERYVPKWSIFKKPMDSFDDPDWDSKFHVWVLEWDYDRMAIYVDDELLNEIDLKQTFNESDGRNPFRQPHFLLLNLAIGGDNGGNPEAPDYPTRFEVDYVRVFQKKDK